jgi:hypothetical protein
MEKLIINNIKTMYNLNYFELMLRQNSKTAQDLCAIRWDFIKDAGAKLILDYGSGPGWFRAFRPEGVEVDTFDIGGYPQTGINHKKYDLITLWDVLEHIPEAEDLSIWKTTKMVAVTVPCVPKGFTVEQLKTWKHYKPGEHLVNFTEELLDEFFSSIGFKKVKSGFPECKPNGPREDVITVLYEKSNS